MSHSDFQGTDIYTNMDIRDNKWKATQKNWTLGVKKFSEYLNNLVPWYFPFFL